MLRLKKNRNKITLEVKLFILFNVLFFIGLMNRDLASVVQIVYILFLGAYLARNIGYIYKFDRYYIFYTCYLFVLLILGLWNGNFKSYIYYDVMCFSTFLIQIIYFRFKSPLYFFKGNY